MPAPRPAAPISGEAIREETAHELVGALNAVVGFAHLLAADDGRMARDQRARYSGHVREGAAALMRLVLGVLGVDHGQVTKRASASGTHTIPRAHTLPPALDGDAATHASIVDDLAMNGAPARVFVVDRDERARELLTGFLQGRGYDIRLFPTIQEALVLAEHSPPDVVLLEGATLDAFAAARAMKAVDPFLPVVFVTELGDDGARNRAVDAGAEQFLEKPVSRHDARSRVKNLLNLRRNQLALAAQNEQLKKLQQFKDEMAALMVHDLKSPLSAIAMNLDVALGGLPDDGSFEDVRGALEDCRVASGRLFRMIANLLDIARSEDGRLVARTSPVDPRYLVAKIAQEHVTEAKLRHVSLTWDSTTDGLYEIDPDLLGRVIENLMENGLRYTRPGGSLRVIASDDGEFVEIRVANDGPPIPPDARAHIFEKYGQAPTPGATRVNRGLGLYFCRVAAEAHGGGIALVDEPGMTTCFCVRVARRSVVH